MTHISWGNAVGLFLLKSERYDFLPVKTAKLGFPGGLVRFEDDKLVGHERHRKLFTGFVRLIHIFRRNMLLFKVLEFLFRYKDLASSGILFLTDRRLLSGEILRGNPQHLRLDAHHNVLCHQDDRRFPVLQAKADL